MQQAGMLSPANTQIVVSILPEETINLYGHACKPESSAIVQRAAHRPGAAQVPMAAPTLARIKPKTQRKIGALQREHCRAPRLSVF